MSKFDKLRNFDFYLDLDGVMVDFDKRKYQMKMHYANDNEMWAEIDKHPHWFLSLEAMPDAMELWKFLEPYQPTILTAIPRTAQKEHAADDKREWVKRNLSSTVKVITCYGIEKQLYSHPRGILIDDMGRNIGQWINKGGIGVLHKNAEQTIALLKELQL